MAKQPPIILLHGPTASGKSALAVNVAKESDAVIINADSMQVYKEIPIITAQPTPNEQQNITHYLYGYKSIKEHYSVSDWLKDAVPLITKVRNNSQTPLLVGGTGLYLKSLIEGLSAIPDIPMHIRQEVKKLFEHIGPIEFHKKLASKDSLAAEKLPPSDTQRMLRAYEVVTHTNKSISEWQKQKTTPYFNKNEFRGYFLHPKREDIYKKCNIRFENMIDNGLLDEIKQLHKQKPLPQTPAMKALGIPEIMAYIEGKKNLEEAIEKAQTQTRNYVKRQLTWQRNQFPDFTIIEKPDANLILPFR